MKTNINKKEIKMKKVTLIVAAACLMSPLSALKAGAVHKTHVVMPNADVVKGQWHIIKGKLKAQWGKFTDDEITQMEGTFEELSGKLQKKYGWEKARADKEVNDFVGSCKLKE